MHSLYEYWIVLCEIMSWCKMCKRMNCLIQFNDCLFNFKIVEETMPITSTKWEKSIWNWNQHISMWEIGILYLCLFFYQFTNIHIHMKMGSIQRNTFHRQLPPPCSCLPPFLWLCKIQTFYFLFINNGNWTKPEKSFLIWRLQKSCYIIWIWEMTVVIHMPAAVF